MVFLQTDQLVLRSFRPADAESFAAYRSDPAVARYQGWATPYSLAQARTFIAKMEKTQLGQPGEWYQIALELKASGRLIGDCAFRILAEDPQQAEIGFSLATAFQRQGYMTEAAQAWVDFAFETFALHRIRAICDAENTASARVLERLGMRREGHFVENTWFKGRWSSEYAYALLRREWESRRQAEAARLGGG